jgi:hypothetical protein
MEIARNRMILLIVALVNYNLGMRSRFLFFTLLAACVSAQSPAKQQIHVTVTDDSNRFVTGLQSEHFEVKMDGQARTSLAAEMGGPIAIVTLGAVPQGVSGILEVGDVIGQGSSVEGAVAVLKGSKPMRKVLLVSPEAAVSAVPSGVQVIRAQESVWRKVIVELKNQYQLQFEGPAEGYLEVSLKQPKGLPVLKVQRSIQ